MSSMRCSNTYSLRHHPRPPQWRCPSARNARMSSPVSARAAGIQFAAPNAAAAIDIQVDRESQGRTAPRDPSSALEHYDWRAIKEGVGFLRETRVQLPADPSFACPGSCDSCYDCDMDAVELVGPEAGVSGVAPAPSSARRRGVAWSLATGGRRWPPESQLCRDRDLWVRAVFVAPVRPVWRLTTSRVSRRCRGGFLVKELTHVLVDEPVGEDAGS